MEKKVSLLALVLAATTLGTATAADYPTRPIRFVIPYPPGGPTDIVARLFAQRLGERWNQQVIADNRAGAGGMIGTDLVAKANADGHTVLITAVPHVVNPSLFPKIPYDTTRDFTAVAQLISYANILIVNRSLPVNSVSELIQLAGRDPGKLNYGSGGNGTSQHLSAELFKSMSKTSIVHVPFQGGAAALTALQGGQVSLMFETTLAALPHISAGRVKALAVTSAKRSPFTPDLPTVAESGLPGFEVSSWVGMLVPARVPSNIVGALNSASNEALKREDVRKRISDLGGIPEGGSAGDFSAIIGKDLTKWAQVVAAAKMRVD
jgi:tripartite-type tricarboxylate transporter receptor subunit TctC